MIVARFLARLINLVTDIVVGLLALRIILRLLGASATAPFVAWIYDTTSSILAPFSGMFPSPTIEPKYIIEFSTIFAMIIYSFIGYVLADIVSVLSLKASERERRK